MIMCLSNCVNFCLLTVPYSARLLKLYSSNSFPGKKKKMRFYFSLRFTTLMVNFCEKFPQACYTLFIFCECFRKTQQNMEHSLYTFHISCEFRVLLMPQKNKPQNPPTFCANVDLGTKCKKRKKGRKMQKKVTQNTPLYTYYEIPENDHEMQKTKSV